MNLLSLFTSTATFVGYFVILIVALYVISKSIVVEDKVNEYFMFSIFGFGLIFTKENSNCRPMLNKISKTENRKVFLTCPTWFNNKVINIGGVK